ncbi:MULTISPECIES: hypothetical protein [unclassified Roseovarius]|uniref:hypothetical protein n=1 Tax=unclassified Roseovarius TaxID=2614913 RepID=UPI00273D451C|nr:MULTISPECIES: hypothetical protein [unclassified Roseovarius]
MTTTTTMASAGLIFQGLRDLDIVKIGNRVSNAFEALEENVTGVRILSNDRACISSLNHDVTVAVFEDHMVDGLPRPAPLVVELTINSPHQPNEDCPHQDTVLAHALKSLHWTLSADQVKWVTPGAILSSADFVMATTQPEPTEQTVEPTMSVSRTPSGVVERRYTLPNVDETNDQLQDTLTQKAVLSIESGKHGSLYAAFLSDIESISHADPDEEIREKTAALRLSAWMVSFTVMIFALPVGAALLVFNILKGENLRLSSQAAALTGTFITLDAHGATAQTMALLHGLIG